MSEFDLNAFVLAFAAGMEAADAKRPVAVNARSGTVFEPGLGPHSEDASVDLVVQEFFRLPLWEQYGFQKQVPYANSPRSKADLVLIHGSVPAAVIEAKLFRMLGDNGKPNDNMLMHILSPYAAHRSAVTDVAKLARSGLDGRRCVLIFGYDSELYPAEIALRAFESLAQEHAQLGSRRLAKTGELVHPVHRFGLVAAWEIQAAA